MTSVRKKIVNSINAECVYELVLNELLWFNAFIFVTNLPHIYVRLSNLSSV